MLFLYRTGRFIALRMPLKFTYWLATVVSAIYFAFSRKDRVAVISNLTVIFPDYPQKRIRSMAREVFINFGKYLIDFFRFSIVDRAYIKEYVKLENIEYLHEGLKQNNGVIAATAHLGNWELGGAVVAALGYPFAAVALNHDDPEVTRFFIRQREVTGAEVIPVGMGIRRCFSALKENKVLALVGDRDYFDNGLEMDFLGKKMLVPKGPAVFSRRCGSVIVPTFMIRNPDDTFTFRFFKPIMAVATKDERRDLMDTTEQIISVLEQVIREYPTQWYIFREFWKKISWGKRFL